MTEHGNPDLIAHIRRKIEAGTLPTVRPSQVWAADASGKPCAACDLAIEAPEVEYEADIDGVRALRFHRKCFEAWYFERNVTTADLRGLADALVGGPTPLCADCLAERLSVPVTRVLVLVERMSGAIAVKRALGQCVRCSRHVEVFSIR
jgi:hypothetical protein